MSCWLTQWATIGIGHVPHRDENEVDECPDTTTSEGEEFGDPQSPVAKIEAINAQRAEEDRQNQSGRVLLVREDSRNLRCLNGVLARGRLNHGRGSDDLGLGHSLQVNHGVNPVVRSIGHHLESLAPSNRGTSPRR